MFHLQLPMYFRDVNHQLLFTTEIILAISLLKCLIS